MDAGDRPISAPVADSAEFNGGEYGHVVPGAPPVDRVHTMPEDDAQTPKADTGRRPSRRPRPAVAHRNDGLRKRCACGRRNWSRCGHAWHVNFSCHGQEHRFCLNKAAGKAPDYVMGKTEAGALRDLYRSQLRSGTFAGVVASHAGTESRPWHAMTFGQLADLYLEQHVRIPTRRPLSRKLMELHVDRLRRIEVPVVGARPAPLSARPIAGITKSDVEAVRRIWRAHMPRAKSGEVGTNRLLSRLRHMFNWAIAEGYADATPFKRHGVTVVKLASWAESPRYRRLEEGEEERLLAAANPHLRDVIAAALETGCRLGELLSMQWHQVRWAENAILLPPTKTKTGEARVIPMTARLRGALEARGRALEENGAVNPDAHVFGNEVGDRVVSIRTAWDNCRRRAGVRDLHFHDLRREFASRLLESPGVALHDVSDWIGHTNIATTSRYLAAAGFRRQLTLERFEQARSNRAGPWSQTARSVGGIP